MLRSLPGDISVYLFLYYFMVSAIWFLQSLSFGLQKHYQTERFLSTNVDLSLGLLPKSSPGAEASATQTINAENDRFQRLIDRLLDAVSPEQYPGESAEVLEHLDSTIGEFPDMMMWPSSERASTS